MKEKMGEELFNDWIESKVNDLNNFYLEQSKITPKKGEEL